MFIMENFLFTCVIYTFEILGTAFVSLLDTSKPIDNRKSLMGWSYGWMFPLYFTMVILFRLFFLLIGGLSWYWIIPIVYVFGLLSMTGSETGYGWLLNRLLGFCPWSKYTKEQRGILLGYSRWDWSLMYGGLAVVFFYFIKLYTYLK